MKKPNLTLRLTKSLLKDCIIYGFSKSIGKPINEATVIYMCRRIHKRILAKTDKELAVKIDWDEEEICFTVESPDYSLLLSANIINHLKPTQWERIEP